jgi:signal transduction histidine kinase
MGEHRRSVDALAAEALDEVRQAITSEHPTELGPASLELAVRAAYPLVVAGRLAADRGTAK